jgi:hypothetical protein
MLAGLLLVSCSELEDSPQQMKELERIAKKSQINLNDPGLTFASALASGLQDESLRSFVFDKTQEQFDGDFNFLYYTEKNTPVGGVNSKSMTFEEALFGESSRFKLSNSFTDFDPLMQVALRGEDEDLYSIESLGADVPVFYVSPDQDLEQNPTVPVFYPDGEVGEWDINQVPEEPVLIVGLNERLIKVERGANQRIALSTCLGASDPYFSDGMNDYYFIDDYMCGGTAGGGNGTGGSGGTGTGGTTGCDRDQNSNPDILDRAKFESMYWMDQAEAWLDGKPEVYFILFTGGNSGSLAQLPPKSLPRVDRSKWKDCGLFSCNPEWVYNINLEIFNWDLQFHGQAVNIRFFEYDPGDSETRSFSVSVKDAAGNSQTFTSSTTLSNNDFDLQGSQINYCEDVTGTDLKIHTTGRFNFGIKINE